MRLRQARKIAKRMSAHYERPVRLLEGEAKSVKPPGGPWWGVYRHSTLQSAERRVERAWLAHCTRWPSGNPQSIDADYYRTNRLHSFVIRQPLVKANIRAGWRP